MSEPLPFRSCAVRPLSCFEASWGRLKGEYWRFVGITFLGLLVGSAAPLGILMGPMMCGLAMCYLDRGRGVQPSLEKLFKGFDHFTESLVAMLVMMGVTLAVFLPVVAIGVAVWIAALAGAATSHIGEAFVGLGCMLLAVLVGLLVFLSIVIGTLFVFTFPLIADRHLRGMDALRQGFRAALANWPGLLGLGLLCALAGVIGVCFCYVGAFLVAPFTLGAQFIAYEQVFGRTSEAFP